MSSANIQTAAQQIPASFESTDLVLTHVKYSFIIGVAIFIIVFPFCRSKKSFWDAIAARRVVAVLRFFVLIECLANCVLLHLYLAYGSPIYLHAQLSYGTGDSWLFGYGRPIAGLVFIGLGLFGDMHPVPRVFCMIACGGQVFTDTLSAYQIHDYYKQVKFHSAPSNGYSLDTLLVYYWRDIIAIGLCTSSLLFAGALACIVGWCDPQLIHPSFISGKEYDRYAVMHMMRDRRREMDINGYAQRDALRLLKSRKNINNDKSQAKPDENENENDKEEDDNKQDNAEGGDVSRDEKVDLEVAEST